MHSHGSLSGRDVIPDFDGNLAGLTSYSIVRCSRRRLRVRAGVRFDSLPETAGFGEACGVVVVEVRSEQISVEVDDGVGRVGFGAEAGQGHAVRPAGSGDFAGG